MAERVCTVPECGRQVRARGLCQSHYKHVRKTGAPRSIRKVRVRRLGAHKVSGLSLSPACAEEVLREARMRDFSPGAIIVDAIEAWARASPGERV